MKQGHSFTQAGRLINFNYGGRQVACNYYLHVLTIILPIKNWINILVQVGDRKDVYEITIEQPENAVALRPKTALDQKVRTLVETYLYTWLRTSLRSL